MMILWVGTVVRSRTDVDGFLCIQLCVSQVERKRAAHCETVAWNRGNREVEPHQSLRVAFTVAPPVTVARKTLPGYDIQQWLPT
jgi:hypothetical protein